MSQDTSGDDEVRAAIGGVVRLSFWARALRAGFWPPAINLSAAIATLVVIWGGPRWIAVALGCASLVAGGLRIPWSNLAVRHLNAPTGLWVQSRVVLLLGLAVAFARDDAGPVLWAALSGCVAATVVEPTIRTTSEAGYPVVLNLPGVPVRASAWLPTGWVYVANLTALIFLGVTSWAGLPEVTALVVCAGTTALAVVSFADAFQRLARRHEIESGLTELLEGYGPQFALHWQAPAGTAYQAAMWLPHLAQLGRPHVVVVRTEVNLRDVTPLTLAPIVLRKSLEDLDPVVTSTLRLVFYVNTAVRNSHMVRYSQLTHVQLNHGDSDKAPSFNPVFRMYDHDFVAGQAAIDRFAAHGVSMPPEMFTIVGRPQVADVTVAAGPISAISGGVGPRVLYAPTWSGFYADSDYSSLRVGVEIVTALLARGCTVVFRPHPYARGTPSFARACDQIADLLERDRNATGRAHLFGQVAEVGMSVTDCFNASDALVGDVSSVVADYLFSEKPFAMVAVSEPAEDFTKHFPIAEAAYVVDGFGGTLRGLEASLGAMLGEDPLLPVRRSVKTYYLGDIPAESYGRRFLDEATALLDAPRA